jgi:hypothetical protein
MAMRMLLLPPGLSVPMLWQYLYLKTTLAAVTMRPVCVLRLISGLNIMSPYNEYNAKHLILTNDYIFGAPH